MFSHKFTSKMLKFPCKYFSNKKTPKAEKQRKWLLAGEEGSNSPNKNEKTDEPAATSVLICPFTPKATFISIHINQVRHLNNR